MSCSLFYFILCKNENFYDIHIVFSYAKSLSYYLQSILEIFKLSCLNKRQGIFEDFKGLNLL